MRQTCCLWQHVPQLVEPLCCIPTPLGRPCGEASVRQPALSLKPGACDGRPLVGVTRDVPRTDEWLQERPPLVGVLVGLIQALMEPSQAAAILHLATDKMERFRNEDFEQRAVIHRAHPQMRHPALPPVQQSQQEGRRERLRAARQSPLDPEKLPAEGRQVLDPVHEEPDVLAMPAPLGKRRRLAGRFSPLHSVSRLCSTQSRSRVTGP
jgi:hypothetical protein